MTNRSRTDENGGVRRRQVLRTSAWAVPTLVVAVPAPAFASSQARGIITVTGFTAFNTQFPRRIGWNEFFIHFDPNGGPDGVPGTLDLSVVPGGGTVLGSSFTLFSTSPQSIGSGRTADLDPGVYRLVVTVSSDAAPTVVVQSDEVTIN